MTKTKEFDLEEYMNEKVPVTVSGENDITVTLNGVNYRIKKGHSVMIPRKAALIIEQSAEQDTAAKEYLEMLGSR